jgi:hypothetical protein
MTTNSDNQNHLIEDLGKIWARIPDSIKPFVAIVMIITFILGLLAAFQITVKLAATEYLKHSSAVNQAVEEQLKSSSLLKDAVADDLKDSSILKDAARDALKDPAVLKSFSLNSHPQMTFDAYGSILQYAGAEQYINPKEIDFDWATFSGVTVPTHIHMGFSRPAPGTPHVAALTDPGVAIVSTHGKGLDWEFSINWNGYPKIGSQTNAYTHQYLLDFLSNNP